MKKTFLILLSVLVVVVGLPVTAALISPWPSALVIRHVFNQGSAAASAGLVKHVPAGITAIRNEPYDTADPDAVLDVYFPSAPESPHRSNPTVVWVHGGGWVSGHKDDIGAYAQVLAGKGFTVVSVNYTIAPEAHHPTPARQVSAALGHLTRHAERLHVNARQLVLAGDSAGSQIVSQTALVTTEPDYARLVGITPSIKGEQLAGMLLYCGAFDAASVNLNGPFGLFLRSVLWSYSGSRNFQNDPAFAPMSVLQHVTERFPPSFISAGNGDPLLAQSFGMARALKAKGVRVETLFFPDDYEPSLPHEYQFNLDTEAGKDALTTSVAFLMSL